MKSCFIRKQISGRVILFALLVLSCFSLAACSGSGTPREGEALPSAAPEGISPTACAGTPTPDANRYLRRKTATTVSGRDSYRVTETFTEDGSLSLRVSESRSGDGEEWILDSKTYPDSEVPGMLVTEIYHAGTLTVKERSVQLSDGREKIQTVNYDSGIVVRETEEILGEDGLVEELTVTDWDGDLGDREYVRYRTDRTAVPYSSWKVTIRRDGVLESDRVSYSCPDTQYIPATFEQPELAIVDVVEETKSNTNEPTVTRTELRSGSLCYRLSSRVAADDPDVPQGRIVKYVAERDGEESELTLYYGDAEEVRLTGAALDGRLWTVPNTESFTEKLDEYGSYCVRRVSAKTGEKYIAFEHICDSQGRVIRETRKNENDLVTEDYTAEYRKGDNETVVIERQLNARDAAGSGRYKITESHRDAERGLLLRESIEYDQNRRYVTEYTYDAYGNVTECVRSTEKEVLNVTRYDNEYARRP